MVSLKKEDNLSKSGADPGYIWLKDKLEPVYFLFTALLDTWVGGIPPSLELRVDNDYEERRAKIKAARDELAKDGIIFISDPDPTPSSTDKIIRLTCGDCSSNAYRYDYEGILVIDLNTKRINKGWSSPELFGVRTPRGTDLTFGIFLLLTLPIALLLLPLILIIRLYYNYQERRHEMSRYSHAILKALNGQLDKETEELLTEAMRNSWRHEQWLKKAVTLEEAKELLSGCELEEKTVKARTTETSEYPTWRQFHWYNSENECLAHGIINDCEYVHHIQVLGSVFENQEADELIKCYLIKNTAGN